MESRVVIREMSPVAHQKATIRDIIKKKLAILRHKKFNKGLISSKESCWLNLEAKVLKPQNTNSPPNKHDEIYPKGKERVG